MVVKKMILDLYRLQFRSCPWNSLFSYPSEDFSISVIPILFTYKMRISISKT